MANNAENDGSKGKTGTGALCGAVVLYVLIPFSPVIAELVVKGSMPADLLALAASIYCISIALSSQRILVFCLGLFLAFLYALSYGQMEAVGGQSGSHQAGAPTAVPAPQDTENKQKSEPVPLIVWLVIAGVGGLGLCHGMERWERHGSEGEPVVKLEK